jgi:hypothetical protein
MIRYNTQRSSYFGGTHAHYGRYQWNVKRYDWSDDLEINDAQLNAIDEIRFALNEPKLSISFEGRSGGWLVIHDPLEPSELKLIDKLIRQYHKTKVGDL